MIKTGAIRVGGIPEPKPATLVDAGTPIEPHGAPAPYVSRGGKKLAAALEAFGIDVEGKRALDAGASTGGFTDVLLQHGASEVTAVDVGYGQLDSRLRDDPRVRVFDRTNIRHVAPETLQAPFELIVADLSFISLCTVATRLRELAARGADLVMLVKPQFEVGRAHIGKGGVVRDPQLHRAALEKVWDCLHKSDIGPLGVVASPILGAKGNREFLVWAKAGAPPEVLEVPE